MVISPLVRGRIPTFVESVNTVITPGTSVDVVVTEIGIAINPNRQDLIEHFKGLDVPQYTIKELQEKAYSIVGNPEPIQYGDKVVAVIEYRDGSIMTLFAMFNSLFDGAPVDIMQMLDARERRARTQQHY